MWIEINDRHNQPEFINFDSVLALEVRKNAVIITMINDMTVIFEQATETVARAEYARIVKDIIAYQSKLAD